MSAERHRHLHAERPGATRTFGCSVTGQLHDCQSNVTGAYTTAAGLSSVSLQGTIGIGSTG